MSCIFCDSVEHLTQNCDKYVTDVERNRHLFAINTCKHCKSSYDKYYTFCIKCEPITKCFSCFSRQHHTFFCPVRESHPPKWFVPRIDQALFKRFFNMFDPLEQYSFVISDPVALNYVKLKKVKVRSDINYTNFQKPFNDDIVVVDGDAKFQYSKDDGIILFNSSSDAYFNFIEAVSNKLLFIKAQTVTLKSVNLTCKDFYYLISPITKVLKCDKIVFTPDISFAEIVKKLPNLEILSFYRTYIETENTWVDDLKIYGKKIVSLEMDVKDLVFNVKALAKIIKTKRMRVSLHLDDLVSGTEARSILVTEEFLNYFKFTSPKSSSTFYFLLVYNPHVYNHYLTPI
uniref:Uncharacterized protein n=1 Tax=Panagrolaimus davidi TaxID=227884 RepID=A0A914NZK4_9BILA